MDSIEDYLNTYTHSFTYNHENTKVAVIVEPRQTHMLKLVVNQVMCELGPTWNLHIFAHNEQYVKSLFVGSSYSLTLLKKNNLSIVDYNTLFFSLDFWNSIKEEHILIFQTDSFILNGNRFKDDFLKYPFIGGIYQYWIPYEEYAYYKSKNQVAGYYTHFNRSKDQSIIQLHNSPRSEYSINGGFSLRQKSKMIECIQKVSVQNIIEYRKSKNMNTHYYESSQIVSEDSFFMNALDYLNYTLPGQSVCVEFCENLSDPSSFNIEAWGVHNIKEHRLTQQFIHSFKNKKHNSVKEVIIHF